MTDQVDTTILAGRLVDVRKGTVEKDQAIVVRDGRIQDVVPKGDARPQGEVIDLGSMTVLPGLIDCHAHLAGQLEDGQGYAGLVTTTPAREVMAGTRNARAALMAGFTSVRDVGSFYAFTDCALRDGIQAGWIPGPRMQCAGAYVTVPGGGGDVTGLAPGVEVPRDLRFGVSKSVDEVRDAVRRILGGGAELIKVIATGAVLTEGTDPGAPEFSEAEIRAAVEEAGMHGAHVAAHAHGAEGIKRAVRAGVRSIEHGSLMDDESVAMMAEAGTYLVADIYNGDFINEMGAEQGWTPDVMRKNRETTEAQREGFRKAVGAGVRVAFGTDSGVFPHEFAARQLPYMVRHGMTPMQGIQAATLVAAEMMSWDDRVGSISPGTYADIIAVEDDPIASGLERMTEVAFVMKGGQVYKGQ